MGHDREKEAAFFFGNCHTKFKNLCYTMPMLRVKGLDKSGFAEEIIVLTVYKPEYGDLWFRERMLSDAETMTYNHAWGGTIPFPKEHWKKWYDHWITNTDGKRYYRYIKNEADEYIGEIAYHYDSEINGFIANVIVYAKYRGNGYGGFALDALCAAAKENGISVLYDDIAIDNPAVYLFLKHGFSEDHRTKEKIVLKKEL